MKLVVQLEPNWVLILLQVKLVEEVIRFSFKSKSSWVILPPPLEEITLLPSIVIFVPAVYVFCFEAINVEILTSATVKISHLISPSTASV